MLFLYRKGVTVKEALRDVKEVFGEAALAKAACYKWYKKFGSGDFNLDDAPRSGRPSVLDLDVLSAKIEANPMCTIKELEEELGVSHGSVCKGLRTLGMVHKLSKWVPHELSVKNKEDRMRICAILLSRFRDDPFLDRLVTCDEKWVFYENVTRSKHWAKPGEAALTQPKRNIHSMKVMLCCWWDMRGVIHFELLGRNQTINTDLYCQQLQRVHEKLVQTRPHLINRKGVLFHQDNARPHVSRASLAKIRELNWGLVEHPPYSPDLAPSDYHLFRSLQNFLAGQKFSSFEGVQKGITNFFNSKQPEFFKRGIGKLPSRWEEVSRAGGEYIVD